ncbi:MAG: glycosyltransferase family 4 protein [Candidatus Aenigmarchaeota archaeon]|nr:glycosyltransferase family 4 protein [Candidatus Aenigmarchaeota archaeon]
MQKAKRFHIGDIAWEFPPNIVGGLGTYQDELFKRLAKKFQITAIPLMRDGDKKAHEQINGAEVYRIRPEPELFDCYKLLTPNEWYVGGDYFDFTIQSIEILCKIEHLDLIHSHDWLGMWAGLVASRHLNKPWVITMHSCEIGRNPNPNPWIVEIEKLGSRADRVIAVSNGIKDELIRMDYPNKKIEVIHNGIDLEKFDPRKIPSEQSKKKLGYDDKKIIFFVGRPVREKGIDTLLKAFDEVKKEISDAKLVLLSRGDIPNLAPDVIHINDFVSEQERIALISACDVFVVPSLYEPFGIVAVEGLAMEKAVIGSRTGGIKEIIEDGKSGLLFEPGNHMELADKIKFLLKNDSERKRLERSARKRAAYFSWEKNARKVTSIYNSLLNRERSRT